MRIYDNIFLKDYKFFDGEECVGFIIDDSSCEFKGTFFSFKTLQELRNKIRAYFCKPVKIEISKRQLNEILGSGLTLDFHDIRGKELVNISVKFGTDSQTLVTEWV